ncbi:unnamed protein product [Hymenolepis diminuta]|uniref:LITAF domain-containing protein n=1 Tax=Hymenolepis diminuta TaxID=6216 RepID=A0A564Y878_HYMDI|nr:unnamed protein product [Hymenolepis diminuta]
MSKLDGDTSKGTGENYAPPPHYDEVIGNMPELPDPVTDQPPIMVVIGENKFGEVPMNVHCDYCNRAVITETEITPGTCTYLACLGLCLAGCDLGCCFIPFCVDSCQDVRHYCPICKRQLGYMDRFK